MSREDKFFRMSIHLPFDEVRDDRSETTVPELAHVAELRDAGRSEDAIAYATSLIKLYPDLDLVPVTLSHLYSQIGLADQALATAVQAIPNCPRKLHLYAAAGLAEFDRGRLAEAFVWWARSAVAQCAIADFRDHEPFLYLAHAAEAVGGTDEADMFFTMSDAIEPRAMRLRETAYAQLAAVAGHWARDPLLRVLRYINAEYLQT